MDPRLPDPQRQASGRIVLTRPEAQASALEEGLLSAGHTVAHMPLTQQVAPDEPGRLRRALAELLEGQFDWLLLTSANTVRALVHCGWDGTLPARTRLGVVGPGTARVLREQSGAPTPWVPQQHSAAGILAELPAPASGARLLLPQSAQARPELAAGLSAKGWDVTRVSAYATRALDRPAVSLRHGDTVLVTSSTAAAAWVRLQVHSVRVLAIGEPTAQTLRQLGRPADAVLTEPTAAGVREALARLGVSRPVAEP